MTHFAVLVIGENIENQLQPYHEFECTGIDDEYIIDQDITQETKEEYEDKKDEYNTFEEYLEDWYGIDPEEEKYSRIEKDNNGNIIKVIKRTNPNYKWDWWEIGGRYSGLLQLKKGAKGYLAERHFGVSIEYHKALKEENKTDQALKGYIDFSPDKKEIERLKRFWEVFIEGDEPKNEIEEKYKFQIYNKKFYIDRYKTKEYYIKTSSEFSTYAVVKDSVWYAKGEMGWFACSSETHEESRDWDDNFYDIWIKDLPDNTLLTVVDCHI